MLAMDTLLAELANWQPKDIPDGFMMMMVKSCMNIQQVDRLASIIEKADFSAQVMFAFIEVLQHFK